MPRAAYSKAELEPAGRVARPGQAELVRPGQAEARPTTIRLKTIIELVQSNETSRPRPKCRMRPWAAESKLAVHRKLIVNFFRSLDAGSQILSVRGLF